MITWAVCCQDSVKSNTRIGLEDVNEQNGSRLDDHRAFSRTI